MTPDLSTGRFFRPIRIVLHGCDTLFGVALVWIHYGFHASKSDILSVFAASLCLQAGSGCLRQLSRWQSDHAPDTADIGVRRRMGELFCMGSICFGVGLALAMGRGMEVLAFAAARAAMGLARAALALRVPFLDGMLAGCVRLTKVLMGVALYPMVWGVRDDRFMLLPLGLIAAYGLCVGVIEAMSRDRLRDALMGLAFLVIGVAAWTTFCGTWETESYAILPYLMLLGVTAAASARQLIWHGLYVRAAWSGGVLLQGAMLFYLARQEGDLPLLIPLAFCLLPALAELLPSAQDRQGATLDMSSFTRTA